MTSFESNPMNALEGLLEERRRYEGWLAQLEARRADSPAHVVERVRSDYQGRLDAVLSRLRDRAEELTSSAATLRERIGILLGNETLRRDERSELELRAMVGEFAPEEAQRSIAACDEALGHLMAERGGLEAELARITEVLALVAEPTPEPAEPEREEEAVAAGREAQADRSPDEAGTQDRAIPSALETSTLGTTEPSALAELAFLQSVVSSTSEPPSQPAATEPVAEPLREAQLPQGSGVPAPSTSDLLPPPVLSAPRRPVTPLSTSIPSSRDAFGNSAAASTLTPGSIPSFFKDMPTEQVKTLKCQECGTMNYPTEWYCERCGGELAAM